MSAHVTHNGGVPAPSRAMSPRCRLGPAGRAATHGGENETTAAIAEGQNAVGGSPDIDNHKYEASPRTAAPLTPQAGLGAAAAPPGAHGTAAGGGAERGGGATPAPAAPSRPGGGADPAAAPHRNAGRAPPSHPAGAERRAALTLCAGADLGHRFLHRRHRRGGGAAASLHGRALHLPRGPGRRRRLLRQPEAAAPAARGGASPRLRSPRWRRRFSLTAAAPALRTRRPPPEPTNSAPALRASLSRAVPSPSPRPAALGLVGPPR